MGAHQGLAERLARQAAGVQIAFSRFLSFHMLNLSPHCGILEPHGPRFKPSNCLIRNLSEIDSPRRPGNLSESASPRQLRHIRARLPFALKGIVRRGGDVFGMQ